MLGAAQKIMAKPSDLRIRLIRIVFSLILIALIVFGWEVTALHWGIPDEAKYALYLFPAVGLIRGIFDPGWFRKRVWKWIVFGLGLAMLVISLFFIEDRPLPTALSTEAITASGTLDVEALSQSSTGPVFTLSTDNWFGVLGVLVMFVGFFLNNKNLTRKNEKYGEKITKIRV